MSGNNKEVKCSCLFSIIFNFFAHPKRFRKALKEIKKAQKKQKEENAMRAAGCELFFIYLESTVVKKLSLLARFGA
jgi:hypothetical protein